uniref:HIT domain-containing protein n=1 Tax=Oncorhynchus tshawytscha TaxID=74940 RepID=A0A8C8H7N0_ONCTS
SPMPCWATIHEPSLPSGGPSTISFDSINCHFYLNTNTSYCYCDDELVCFRDLKPGARHHYLVVPRTHVGNCKSLRKEHIPLVEKMEEMGRSVLHKKKVTDLDDIRMGLHMPPFSSVPHLHLHVIAPASQMSITSLRNYGPQSYWFITVNRSKQKLKK